jgi:hypothetical protein
LEAYLLRDGWKFVEHSRLFVEDSQSGRLVEDVDIGRTMPMTRG